MFDRIRGIAVAFACLVVLAACGGGGGGSGASGGSTGGSGDGGGSAAGTNVLPVSVDSGPAGVNGINLPYVSVTVCVPGSASRCQTIDHVLLDTGSTGLRIMASVFAAPSTLPSQTDQAGNPLAECVAFLDGVTWGSVRLADVRLGGVSASSVPIQVVGDPAFPSVPSACSSQGVPMNTVQSFGANGVLGVGTFLEDCGSYCAQFAHSGGYYACPASGCQPAAVALAKQVGNPVASLPADNNGVLVQLGPVPPEGAPTVSGTLTLGIGTRGNNAFSRAVAFDVDANANLTTTFNGRSLAVSFFDTGSNAFFFPSSTIPVCGSSTSAPGYYCPAATQALTATVQGAGNGASGTVSFSVANASDVYSANPDFAAFGNLAAPPGASMFDWGLPFFYGRSVYVAFEGRTTPAGAGPYVAF